MTDGTEIEKFKGDFLDSFTGQMQGRKQVLLHTRFATWGAQTAENSHPFAIGSIIGVHNGQIYNHAEAAKALTGDGSGVGPVFKYNVDSEVLLHYLAYGLDLSKLEGYGAVVFFDGDVIHMGRFNGGEMTLVKCDWGWMWASTKTAVDHVLSMSGLMQTAKFDIKLKEGRLYRLVGDAIVKDSRALNIIERPAVEGWGAWSGYNSSGGHSTGKWNQHSRKRWDSQKQSFVDDAGNEYKDYYGPPVNQLPLPTAATTTFTQQALPSPALKEEPESDYDEVVDTADLKEFDPIEYENQTTCAFCHELLQSGHFMIVQECRVCVDCYASYRDKAVSTDDNDTPPDYTFEELTPDELWDEYHDRSLYRCSDCLVWMDDGDHDVVYVCSDGMEQFAVCETCYEFNYSHEEVEEEDGEETVNVPAPTNQCGVTETRVEEGGGTVRCVRQEGHARPCVDYKGEVMGIVAGNKRTQCPTLVSLYGGPFVRCVREEDHQGFCLDSKGNVLEILEDAPVAS